MDTNPDHHLIIILPSVGDKKWQILTTTVNIKFTYTHYNRPDSPPQTTGRELPLTAVCLPCVKSFGLADGNGNGVRMFL